MLEIDLESGHAEISPALQYLPYMADGLPTTGLFMLTWRSLAGKRPKTDGDSLDHRNCS
jgi:hypothetical protein